MTAIARTLLVGLVALLIAAATGQVIAEPRITVADVKREFGDVNAPREFNTGFMTERLLPLQIVAGNTDAVAQDAIRALVKAGARINAVGPNGNAAIHTAAWRNAAANIRVLAELGADVNLKNRNGETALLLAIGFGKFDAVNALLDAGADPNMADGMGNTAVHRAMRMNDKRMALKILPLLKQHGADVDARNKNGDTPLQMIASVPSRDDEPLVRWLLGAGAKPDVRDEFGDTPLHKIAGQQTSDRNQLAPLLAALVDAGAPIDARNKQGETPLYQAVFQDCFVGGEPRLSQWLLEHGADPTVKANNGQSPLDLAASPELHCGPKIHALFASAPARTVQAKKPETGRSSDRQRLEALIDGYLREVDEMGRAYQQAKKKAVKARGFSGLTTRKLVRSRLRQFAELSDQTLKLVIALEDAHSIIWEAARSKKIKGSRKEVEAAVTRKLGNRLSKDGIRLLKAQASWANAYANVFALLDRYWGMWSVDESRHMVNTSTSELRNQLEKEMKTVQELETLIDRMTQANR